MTLALVSIIVGLVLLVWSADRFVDGAAASAKHFGMSPLVIGMLILGFGTSAPEIVVSTLASLEGKSNLALGNAVGSNIANIALILGLTGLIAPVTVHSKALRSELPLLVLVSAIGCFMLFDNRLSRMEGFILLGMFALFVVWSILKGRKNPDDALAEEMEAELGEEPMPLKKALFWLAAGLALVLVSSRMLVWGAVEVATFFGVSELLIGLTIVALGTSLPELASTLAAARKGEHDIALGNILGSNLFNMMAVAGLAGAIHPLSLEGEFFRRDMLVMMGLTLSLFVFGFQYRKDRPGRISQIDGALLLLAYLAYNSFLIKSVLN